MNVKAKAFDLFGKVKLYWKTPLRGRYMPFKEIASYAGGGIGAYFIMTMGMACILTANNVLIMSTLGVGPVECYIMYVIAVLANVPLTGIRANIIDNTRNKAGKYRPYIVSMAIPTGIVCILMVWFPYNLLESTFGDAMLFGKPTHYIAKCGIILFFNILLHFFYNFFYDAYENLIHVLSPDSQERADVSAIKSVVYSLAPSIVNLITPIIASNVFHSNATDIRVYRLLYPILSVLGILLCIVIYKNTEEKIVQARTHIIQIRFSDALRAVARNKYFWIISLASWIGFLETAYANILFWLYNYGGVCSGDTYGIIVTIYGNASLWGMLLAPVAVRKWGKKAVLVITNIFNILFILLMLPATARLNNSTIWLVLICLYLNGFMGSFMLILTPAIQADIRDYQQYISGERIDGMFSAVGTIGTVVTLLSSAVLPFVNKKEGLTEVMAQKVTSDPGILNRMLGDGKTVGEILNEQLLSGQNNYINPSSALYDPDILTNLLRILIIFSAFGALLNVIPYLWYDFNEKKQKSVIRVLKIRAMFEDYGNGILKDKELVETIDIISQARENALLPIAEVSKKQYKSIKDKSERKQAKKQYKDALALNEEIEISKFVISEIDKFSSPSFEKRIAISQKLCNEGLSGVYNVTENELNEFYNEAKNMPDSTKEEKETRRFMLETARNRKSAFKAYNKYFKDASFESPDMAVLESLFEKEDALDEKLKLLYLERKSAIKDKDMEKLSSLKAEISACSRERKEVRKSGEKEMDKHAYFARAAKPYLDAKKLLLQKENYERYDEIRAKYEESKLRAEKEEQERLEKEAVEKKLSEEYAEKLKNEKKLKKTVKK